MLCLARKERYLICVQGVSITQRHTADASGPRDQLGPARHTAPQSAKMEAHWEHWGGGSMIGFTRPSSAVTFGLCSANKARAVDAS